jgi:hypothetical protein
VPKSLLTPRCTTGFCSDSMKPRCHSERSPSPRGSAVVISVVALPATAARNRSDQWRVQGIALSWTSTGIGRLPRASVSYDCTPIAARHIVFLAELTQRAPRRVGAPWLREPNANRHRWRDSGERRSRGDYLRSRGRNDSTVLKNPTIEIGFEM